MPRKRGPDHHRQHDRRVDVRPQLTAFDAATGALTKVRAFGGAADDRALAVAVDAQDRTLIAGSFQGLVAFDAFPLLAPSPPLNSDGFVAALATAAVVSFLLFRTTLGFEIRATGFSPSAARGAGIRPGRTMVVAMSLSGGLVGMGSAFFGLGPALGLSGGPTYDFGYVAFALALLAGKRPSGVVVASLVYAALNTGAKNMVIATGIPLALLTVVVAFAILFLAAVATPPDMMSQIILFAAIYPLYEGSIILMRRHERQLEAKMRAEGTLGPNESLYGEDEAETKA